MPLLSWFNRDADLTRAALAPYRLLEPVASRHYGDEDSANILIEGDNLEALKALLPYYGGQVKCIFIDPPYNTKSAFEHYDDNLEHSQWLSMMYPRLELLRQLLAEDGSMWVTLDDNEGHYFKVIADEVFGRANFVSNVIWQKLYTVKNSAKYLSDMHEHVFVYARNKNVWRPRLLPRSAELDSSYTNVGEDPRGPWTTNALQARNYYSQGSYEIVSPTGKRFRPPTGTYWRISEENFKALQADGRIWWGANGSNAPRVKKYLLEAKQGVVPATLWLHKDAGTNAEAKAEVRALFSEQGEIFDTPKPEKLIRRVLEIATGPDDLILDSFLGSGTTAAVAHKMGRRWIGIEVGEHARTHCLPRLRAVVDGEQGGISTAVKWKGGGGLRFYKLGAPVFDEQGHIRDGIKFEHLAAHIWFAETGVARSSRAQRSPLLGVHHEIAYYLLYNGILGDDSIAGGNVLTKKLLRSLPKFEGLKVIYGEACSLPEEQLQELEITFKQTPYDIKAR